MEMLGASSCGPTCNWADTRRGPSLPWAAVVGNARVLRLREARTTYRAQARARPSSSSSKLVVRRDGCRPGVVAPLPILASAARRAAPSSDHCHCDSQKDVVRKDAPAAIAAAASLSAPAEPAAPSSSAGAQADVHQPEAAAARGSAAAVGPAGALDHQRPPVPDDRQPWGFSAAASARLLAVVGTGKRSPWGSASWTEVLEQMARKLSRADGDMEMLVLEDAQLLQLQQPHLDSDPQLQQAVAAAFKHADLVVAVAVTDAAAAAHILQETAHVSTLVAFSDSHPDLHLHTRLGGVPPMATASPPPPPHTGTFLLQAVETALRMQLPTGTRRQRQAAKRKLETVEEVWGRASSDNVLLALQILITTYAAPVQSLQRLQAAPDDLPGFLACALGKCGPQVVACLLDPEARAALSCMQQCDPTDQLCTYRCVAGHENPRVRALSLCVLERHNCLGLCAAVPMHLAAAPTRQFRGRPLTHELAEDLLVGWARALGHSWKIAANMFPIASQFRSQTQTFYREASGRVWYDPVFAVTAGGADGRGPDVWRRRHYRVERAAEPGTFAFSFLDNGVTTREFWVVVDVADDLAWALFHSVGAARCTGQTFTGAVVCTPTGEWPGVAHHGRLYGALDRCGIKEWEVLTVDHSSYAGAPRLGPPAHVPEQVFLGLDWDTVVDESGV